MADTSNVDQICNVDNCTKIGRQALTENDKTKIQSVLENALISAGLDDKTIIESSSSAKVCSTRHAGEPRDCCSPSVDHEKRASSDERQIQGSDLVRPAGPSDEDSCASGTEKKQVQVPETEWIDITDKFVSAALQLAPGELVQEVHFTLFDAMSAIEIMDSKMDAALQWKNFPNYPRLPKEAVAKGLVKLDGHSTEELVGIMDEVYTCLATWLEGHTLAQTVFTCLYVLESSSVEDVCLRSFSQAIIKIVECMREAISRNGVYAMEDQQAVSLGMASTEASDTAVSAALKEAEEKINALLRQRSKGGETEETVLKALHSRHKLTRALFGFVSFIAKGTLQGMEAAVQKLAQCWTLVPDIVGTICLGAQLDPQNPLALGFHPVVNQHLLPPSYKPYSILPRQKGYLTLQTIFSQLQEVFRLCKLNSFSELLEGVTNFCNEKQSPNVLARSFLVMLCLKSDRSKLFDTLPIEALIRNDAQQLCNPPSLNAKSPLSLFAQAKEVTDVFFGKAIAPFAELLRVYCHHRACQRQRIPKCLDALSELQQEADRVDHHLHELCLKIDPQRQHLSSFGTWLLYYIMQMMIEFVVLGFEYHLYSPFEYHYVFWYLEYLYGWQQTTLKTAEQILATDMQPITKGKRKTKKKRELTKEKERELYIIQAKRMICVGVMRSLEALLLDKGLPLPTFEFGSEEFTFKYRFLPFMSIVTPTCLAYQDYVKLASVENYKGKDVNLYEAASRHYTAAKCAIETIPYNEAPDLERLLKIVKMNIVIMNLASQGHKKSSAILDFSLHRHFPIVRFV